jgi:hypothetical protein
MINLQVSHFLSSLYHSFVLFLQDEKETQAIMPLSRLNKLRWISIDGCPSDGHLLKEIVLAAPYLSMLIITMKYLLQLIDDQSSIFSRIKYLSIQITNETDLNDNNIEKISNIFSRVAHIILESKIENMSIENILLLFIDHFKNHRLISMIIRGLTTEQLRTNPTQWLIDRTYFKQIINQFKSECDEIEFKIWF